MPELKLHAPEWGDDDLPKSLEPKDSTEDPQDPLDLDYVEGKDWESLLMNVLSAALIAVGMYLVLTHKLHWSHSVALASSISVVWVLAYFSWKYLYTNVQSREGKFYLDPLTGKQFVYGRGFHFTAWYYRPEADDINFQRHEIIVADKKSGTEIIFPTLDGKIEMFVELKLMFVRVGDSDGLGNSLNYELDKIKEIVLARLSRRISDLGGVNAWKDIIQYKSEFIMRAGAVFAGDRKRSPFEKNLGIRIIGMNITRVDLTEASRKFVDTQTRADRVTEIADKQSKELGLPVAVTYKGALAIDGAVSRTETDTTSTIKVEGLPPNATFVSIGGASPGVAVDASKSK